MPLSAKLHLHSAPVAVEVTRDDDTFTLEFATTSAYGSERVNDPQDWNLGQLRDVIEVAVKAYTAYKAALESSK